MQRNSVARNTVAVATTYVDPLAELLTRPLSEFIVNRAMPNIYDIDWDEVNRYIASAPATYTKRMLGTEMICGICGEPWETCSAGKPYGTSRRKWLYHVVKF